MIVAVSLGGCSQKVYGFLPFRVKKREKRGLHE